MQINHGNLDVAIQNKLPLQASYISSEENFMSDKVCQKGVIAAPCNSHALYLLGLAQLAQYDYNPCVANKDILLDAQQSFRASVSLENMPAIGPPKQEITDQKWWQNWKAAEEQKLQQKLQQSQKSEGSTTSSAASAPAKVAGRGRANTIKGTVAQKPAAAASAKSSTPARRAGAASTKGPSTILPRGRGATISPVKPSKGISKPTSGSCESATGNKQTVTPITDKPASPLVEQKPVSCDETTTTTQIVGQQPINRSSYVHHLGLARALSRTEESFGDAKHHYQEVIAMAPEVYDAYIELADLLAKSDLLAAVDIYCRFPLKPVQEQTFDDAFITGEIVRLLMKLEKYDDPRLPPNMIAYGKVMGIGCLEKYMSILDGKFKTELLKTVYAGIHNKSINDPDLQNFFRFKCWI
ncbi:uncharacterized protein LOC122792348 [Protopterus annectens]|uniref:uncharacterized protein LOC122792348 n=1 Tax=Protopterus annectens TaxID=7888 RepID=UPI001CFC2A5A|nr:uncharacterized protein LOC122792348 [Protopterus annectens]